MAHEDVGKDANKATITQDNADDLFSRCGVEPGMPPDSEHLNAVFTLVGNTHFDNMPFTNDPGLESQSLAAVIVQESEPEDYLYIKRGDTAEEPNKILIDELFRQQFKKLRDELPVGYQVITEDIVGEFETILTGSENFPPRAPSPVIYEKVFDTPVTFAVADYQGLGEVGTELKLVARAFTHYNYVPFFGNGGAGQWDVDVYVNGQHVIDSGDGYLLDASGDNSFVATEVAGVWETDGTDMEIRVIQYLSYSPSDSVLGDSFKTDISRVGVRIDLA